ATQLLDIVEVVTGPTTVEHVHGGIVAEPREIIQDRAQRRQAGSAADHQHVPAVFPVDPELATRRTEAPDVPTLRVADDRTRHPTTIDGLHVELDRAVVAWCVRR